MLCCSCLTPILTPTPVNVGERRAAGSKTAGCRFDSCPTCPSQILNSWELQPHRVQPIWRALTPIDPNGSNTGSRAIDAQLLIGDLMQLGPEELCPDNSNLAPSLVLSGHQQKWMSGVATLPTSQFLCAALRLLRLRGAPQGAMSALCPATRQGCWNQVSTPGCTR